MQRLGAEMPGSTEGGRQAESRDQALKMLMGTTKQQNAEKFYAGLSRWLFAVMHYSLDSAKLFVFACGIIPQSLQEED